MTKMNEQTDWKELISHPEPPDDPDKDAEFEEWTFFENGKPVTIRRPNPRYRADDERIERIRQDYFDADDWNMPMPDDE
jgi:hypothetical protein